MELFIIALLVVLPSRCFSAACCGGGFNIPSVIVGDDKTQFTSSLSQSQVADDISSTGIWTPRMGRDTTQTLKLEGATLLADRLQVGMSAPFVKRSVETMLANSNSGVGDVGVVTAYEIMPELEYSLLKPKAFIFSQIISPTGKSIYESTDPLASDVTGRGFWSWGAGFILSKIIYNFDVQLTAEMHKSFDRDIPN